MYVVVVLKSINVRFSQISLGVMLRIRQLAYMMRSANPIKGTVRSLQFSFKLSLLLHKVFPITPVWYEEAESTPIITIKRELTLHYFQLDGVNH